MILGFEPLPGLCAKRDHNIGFCLSPRVTSAGIPAGLHCAKSLLCRTRIILPWRTGRFI
jgi:hypothetical protein